MAVSMGHSRVCDSRYLVFVFADSASETGFVWLLLLLFLFVLYCSRAVLVGNVGGGKARGRSNYRRLEYKTYDLLIVLKVWPA